MNRKVIVLLLCQVLLVAGCTYNTKTKKSSFTPLGAGPHEMIDTIVNDVKECAGQECETKMSSDDYERSKFNSMTNEELDEYVKKQQEKLK